MYIYIGGKPTNPGASFADLKVLEFTHSNSIYHLNDDTIFKCTMFTTIEQPTQSLMIKDLENSCGKNVLFDEQNILTLIYADIKKIPFFILADDQQSRDTILAVLNNITKDNPIYMRTVNPHFGVAPYQFGLNELTNYPYRNTAHYPFPFPMSFNIPYNQAVSDTQLNPVGMVAEPQFHYQLANAVQMPFNAFNPNNTSLGLNNVPTPSQSLETHSTSIQKPLNQMTDIVEAVDNNFFEDLQHLALVAESMKPNETEEDWLFLPTPLMIAKINHKKRKENCTSVQNDLAPKRKYFAK